MVLYVAECRNWARPRNFALRKGHSVASLGNRIAHLWTNLRICMGNFWENGKITILFVSYRTLSKTMWFPCVLKPTINSY